MINLNYCWCVFLTSIKYVIGVNIWTYVSLKWRPIFFQIWKVPNTPYMLIMMIQQVLNRLQYCSPLSWKANRDHFYLKKKNWNSLFPSSHWISLWLRFIQHFTKLKIEVICQFSPSILEFPFSIFEMFTSVISILITLPPHYLPFISSHSTLHT
jgi:hypothetical protein